MRAAEFLCLADLLPEAMLMVSGEGEVLAVNRAASRVLQRSGEELAGVNLAELTGLSSTEIRSRLRPCTRSRTPIRLALMCTHANRESSMSGCEGFLLLPSQNKQPAQIILRMKPAGSRANTFIALNREIDKQKQLLRKLERSRERLRLSEENLAITLNSIGDAVMVTDQAGNLTLLNPVAEQLTGWSNQEARGLAVKTIFPIIDASTRESIENPVEKVIATGKTVYLSNHTTLIARDGREYQIADSAAPIRDGNNAEIQGMVLVFSDVTEQYRLREMNTRSRRNLQAIMDHSSAIFYAKDLAGRYIFVNRQYETLFHIAHEDIIGKTDREIFSSGRSNVFSSDDAIIATGQALESEEMVLHDDGVHHYIASRFPLLDSENKAYAVCGIYTDITRHKQAEQALLESEKKYTTLFEKSTDAVLLVEEDRFVDCNQAAVRMLGYATKKDILQTHPAELSPPRQPDGRESLEKANEMMAIAMEKGRHHFEWIHLRKNGETFPVEVLLTAVPFGGKTVLHVVWRDITERQRTEIALRRVQKMDAIGQLTGGIAHDFNNILGVVLGNLDLLELHTKTDEKAQKRIEGIRHAAQRAVDLTRQLLGFSRSEVSSPVVTDINRQIENMSNLIARSLTPQVEIEHNFCQQIWLTEISSGDFEDALLNLIINARDAMKGRGLLTIETANAVLDEDYCQHEPGVMPGQYIELAVSDNGEGMPADVQERIFEPFFSTKKRGKGTGLGLAMVFGFVKRSGGNIKVYSEPGMGSTFRIYLPRACHLEEEKIIRSPSVQDLPKGKETILVVDDEPGLVELVEETLSRQGYRVITASDGMQALTKFEEEPCVDLLFSDVVMPGGLNGFELAEKLTALQPSLKVLLTSGYTERAIARNGQSRFRMNLLNKPYTQVSLSMKIRALLDN